MNRTLSAFIVALLILCGCSGTASNQYPDSAEESAETITYDEIGLDTVSDVKNLDLEINNDTLDVAFSGNIANHSLVTGDESFLFYSEPIGEQNMIPQGDLVRHDLATGEKKVIKTGYLPAFLNWTNGWLYYADLNDRSIRRINKDGERETLITLMDSIDPLDGLQNMALDGDSIYLSFQSLPENEIKGLYKVSAKTGELTKLVDSSVVNLVLHDGWIYFSLSDDEWSIYKIKPDGSEISKVNSENSLRVNVYNDRLYYISAISRQIVSCDLNGEDREVVIDEAADYRSLIVYEDSAFYSIAGKGIYKMDLASKSVTELSGFENTGLGYNDMSIANDVLFYTDIRNSADGAPYAELLQISLK
ncbi:MAG: DUF5050 domain-containing protein [Clostridiales bacterium]|nr:DUF5050 domain-containing protein [Clostridiales bacterium]